MSKKVDIPVVPEFDVPRTCQAPEQSEEEIQKRIKRIGDLLKSQDAVVISHYYTDAAVQRLAEETGGFVGDSLAMAEFGRASEPKTLMVATINVFL